MIMICWLILWTNAWESSTVISTDYIMVSKNEHITSIHGGYWEKQTLISNIYKITTIASAMKEFMQFWESMIGKASLRKDKSKFKWKKWKNILGRRNSRYKALTVGGSMARIRDWNKANMAGTQSKVRRTWLKPWLNRKVGATLYKTL